MRHQNVRVIKWVNTEVNLTKPNDANAQRLAYSSHYGGNIRKLGSFYRYVVGWVLMNYGLGMYYTDIISMLVDLFNNRNNNLSLVWLMLLLWYSWIYLVGDIVQPFLLLVQRNKMQLNPDLKILIVNLLLSRLWTIRILMQIYLTMSVKSISARKVLLFKEGYVRIEEQKDLMMFGFHGAF